MSLFLIDAGKEWRGGQRQVLFLARELRKTKHSFWLAVQRGGPLHEKAEQEGLPLLPLRMRNEADLLAVLRLAAAMRRRRCVLAHFHDAHGAGLGTRAAGLAKVPLRVISRRVDFPLKSKSKYIKEIDAIIAISEGVKKVLIDDGIPPQLIEVIPSGIDFSPFEEVREHDFLRREFHFGPDDYLVGIVAQLEDHKGHRTSSRRPRSSRARSRG